MGTRLQVTATVGVFPGGTPVILVTGGGHTIQAAVAADIQSITCIH